MKRHTITTASPASRARTKATTRANGTRPNRTPTTGRRPTTAVELLMRYWSPAVERELVEILGLSDPKVVALILARHIAPDRLLEQRQESVLRGVQDKTLRRYKQDKLLPYFVGGK